jgi:hypothetical protein
MAASSHRGLLLLRLWGGGGGVLELKQKKDAASLWVCGEVRDQSAKYGTEKSG